MTLTGFFPMQQCQQYALTKKHPRCGIADCDTDSHRTLSGFTGNRHKATCALNNLINSRSFTVGAFLTETGDTGVDYGRIDCLYRFIINAKAMFHVLAKIFDNDICLAGELHKKRQSFRGFEVDCQSTFVSMQILGIRGISATRNPFTTHWWFYADDIGAPVSQQSYCGGPCSCEREIKYSVSCQR